MLAAAAIGVLVLTAALLAATLRLGLVGTVLAAYVAASAEVVLGAEVLSPFHAVGTPGYLAWEAAAAAAAAAWWLLSGRPRPALPRVDAAALRRHPVLLLLAVSVGAAVAFEAFLALTAAPNNWDALTYHLSRAAAWYQNGSLGFFAAHTARENFLPPNAELQILFTMVFTQGDRLAAMPQLVAELALLAGIFGVARRLGFGRADSTFAALLFATFSEVVLEATSAQNDLVAGAGVVAAAYFLLGTRRSEQLLAATAFALALGTKLTAVYAMPVLAVLALALLPRRRVVEFAAAAVVAFGVFGSLVYVEDALHYGSPLGPSTELGVYEPSINATNTMSTAARTLYRFVDLSGYDAGLPTPISLQAAGKFAFSSLGIASNPAGATQTRFFFSANTRADEDTSYYGPLGALLVLPLAFGYLVAFGLRRTSKAKAALALALPLAAVEVALTYKYNEWLGRFMLVPVALVAALAARAYAQRHIAMLASGIGVIFMGLALVGNERKPIGFPHGKPVWALSRPAAEDLVLPGRISTFEKIAASLPARARVGVLLRDDDWDYPLYGPHLTRRLVVLPKGDALQRARSLRLDWVVAGRLAVGDQTGWARADLGTLELFTPIRRPVAR